MATRHWPAAHEALEDLLRLMPNDAAAQIALADVRFRLGHVRASTRPLLKASEHLPRDGALIVGLAQRLIARGEILAARGCLELLSQAPDPPAEILVAQAHLHYSLGQIPQARAMMERARTAGADAPDEHHLYAMLLQFDGEIDKACDVLESALRRWPRFGDAAMVLANLRKQTPSSDLLPLVQQQLQHWPEATDDPGDRFVRAEFEYARFKALDDMGRHEEAWPALARCNGLMSQLNPYHAAGEAAVADALTALPEALFSAADGAHGAAQPDGPVPIFIVGMPRSGTTLLDRMLSSHSDVVSAGEIIDFWRQLHWVADIPPAQTDGLLRVLERSADIDFPLLGQRYLRQTQWRAQGRRFYIDKLPANVQMVAFIRKALPHAPILHMVREPMDTCFSNFKAMFGNVSAYSYDLNALAHYYRQYSRVTRHWREYLPTAMLDVSYEALVRDPEAVMAGVLEHCGLAIEAACLRPERNTAPVATPSSAQVRESIHTRGIGQWQHYAGQLEPLRRMLAVPSGR